MPVPARALPRNARVYSAFNSPIFVSLTKIGSFYCPIPDLNNPISNKLYINIGFEPIGDSVRWAC